jgi:hypothetical protein
MLFKAPCNAMGLSLATKELRSRLLSSLGAARAHGRKVTRAAREPTRAEWTCMMKMSQMNESDEKITGETKHLYIFPLSTRKSLDVHKNCMRPKCTLTLIDGSMQLTSVQYNGPTFRVVDATLLAEQHAIRAMHWGSGVKKVGVPELVDLPMEKTGEGCLKYSHMNLVLPERPPNMVCGAFFNLMG